LPAAPPDVPLVNVDPPWPPPPLVVAPLVVAPLVVARGPLSVEVCEPPQAPPAAPRAPAAPASAMRARQDRRTKISMVFETSCHEAARRRAAKKDC
jgi:hypothetical protein